MGRFDFIKDVKNQEFNENFPNLYEEMCNVENSWITSKRQALSMGRRQNEIILKALFTRLTGRSHYKIETYKLIEDKEYESLVKEYINTTFYEYQNHLRIKGNPYTHETDPKDRDTEQDARALLDELEYIVKKTIEIYDNPETDVKNKPRIEGVIRLTQDVDKKTGRAYIFAKFENTNFKGTKDENGNFLTTFTWLLLEKQEYKTLYPVGNKLFLDDPKYPELSPKMANGNKVICRLTHKKMSGYLESKPLIISVSKENNPAEKEDKIIIVPTEVDKLGEIIRETTTASKVMDKPKEKIESNEEEIITSTSKSVINVHSKIIICAVALILLLIVLVVAIPKGGNNSGDKGISNKDIDDATVFVKDNSDVKKDVEPVKFIEVNPTSSLTTEVAGPEETTQEEVTENNASENVNGVSPQHQNNQVTQVQNTQATTPRQTTQVVTPQQSAQKQPTIQAQSTPTSGGNIYGSATIEGLTLSVDGPSGKSITLYFNNGGNRFSVGWVSPAQVTAITDTGNYYATINDGPADNVEAGEVSAMTMNFNNMSGTISQIKIENIYKLDNRGLPEFHPSGGHTFIIPVSYR